MITITSEMLRPFDVDDTLVFAPTPNWERSGTEYIIEVLDPVTKNSIRRIVNPPMVRLLEEEHHRGGYIIVWSRGGYEWAKAVIYALGLENKVHLVMSKPMVYFDDKPVNEWMLDRIYIPPGTEYKTPLDKKNK